MILMAGVARVCVFALQETAINIGYACSLITDDMTQFQMQGACLETDRLEAEGRVSSRGAAELAAAADLHGCSSILCTHAFLNGLSSCGLTVQ